MKVDVVALVTTGKEVAGSSHIYLDREGYRYFFVSEMNKQRFASTHRYDIQLGGGCGKMGSLFGKGSTERFAVHEGKVYLFASDGCRTGFLENPDLRIERDDPAPTGSAEQKKLGKQLFDKAVEWMGGKQVLLDIKTYHEVQNGSYSQGDQTMPLVVRRVYTYPDSLAHFETYGKDLYSTVAKKGAGTFGMPSGKTEVFFSAQVREMERIRDHKLVPAVKSGLGRGAVAVAGTEVAGLTPVAVFRAGIGVKIWVAKEDGSISAIESRSRGPRGEYGNVKLKFKSFRTVNGVKVPVAWDAFFNGEPTPSLSTDNHEVRFDRVGVPKV